MFLITSDLGQNIASGRILLGCWLVTILIIGTVYRDNLKASLIAPKIEIPFSTVEDLAERDVMPPIVAKDSAFHQLIKVRSCTMAAKDIVSTFLRSLALESFL